MHNHNPRMNQLKHAVFGAFSGDPSDAEQKKIDERQSEGDRREAIFVELVGSIEEFARLIASGRIDGTESITYATARKWLPTFVSPKLYFSVKKETAKVLFERPKGKRREIVAITKSGALVASFQYGGEAWLIGPTDEREVDINRVRPNDIRPEDWGVLESAACKAKSILAYAKSKKARN